MSEMELFCCHGCNGVFAQEDARHGLRCPTCDVALKPYKWEYVDVCPFCKGRIQCCSAFLICEAPVSGDGIDFTASKAWNTEEERFECRECNRGIPSDWVFGRISNAEAKARADQAEGRYVVELTGRRRVRATTELVALSPDEARQKIDEDLDLFGELDWRSEELEDVEIVDVRRA